MALGVNIGDRFEELRDSPFGTTRRQWIVVQERPGPIPHVTIRDVAGILADKSISVSALTASRWFQPLRGIASKG